MPSLVGSEMCIRDRDKDIVNFNEEEAHIRAYLEKKEDEIRIDMHLRKNKSKGIAIDGTRIKKAAELLGIMNVVFFSPEDLSIIKNGPAERRHFVDMEPASYTHLTLPTIYYVQISVVAISLKKERCS